MTKSSKPSSQRRTRFQAPIHVRRKFLSAALSDELQFRYNRNSWRLKKGDTVKVQRGDYTGVEGKITAINAKTLRVTIEGITREKADGTQKTVPVSPSKLVITKLNTDDKWRAQRLSAKMAATEQGPPPKET